MKRFLNIISSLVTVAALVYIAYRVMSFDIEWSSLFVNHHVVISFVVTFFLYEISLCLVARNYVYILSKLSGIKIPSRPMFRVYMIANVYKYLPGNVLHFVGRNALARDLGVEQSELAFSTIFEIASQAIVILILCLVFSFRWVIDLLRLAWSDAQAWIFIVLILLVLCGIAFFVFSRVSQKVRNIVRRVFSQGSWKLWFSSGVTFIWYFFANGIGFAVLLWQLGISQDLFQESAPLILIIASYNLAWLAGFLTPGAPGGIGIKEAVMLFVLKNVIGESTLLLALVAHRIVLIIADVIAFAFAFLFIRSDDVVHSSENE